MADLYGPALPPGFKKSEPSPDSGVIGPALPPGFVARGSNDENESCAAEENETTIGPSHLNRKESKQDSFIGPVLPSSIKKTLASSIEDNIIGPVPPPGFKVDLRDDSDSDSDDSIIGPLPCEAAGIDCHDDVRYDVERRAKKMKLHLESKNASSESKLANREEWMMELPSEISPRIGIVARGFSQRMPVSQDRSGWTETPADRAKKHKEKTFKGNIDPQIIAQCSKDKAISKKLEEYNKTRRSESLLEMHRRKRRKEAKEAESKPKERIPFNRDEDLQIQKIDPSQAKSVLNKARLLNSRFSHGTNQFL